ncbi:MAG: FHA domain-containing protein [Fimbriimonadaceae bacterium]|nr:FHA domain-containing protein [Fimbriimonadaceae bacterium]
MVENDNLSVAEVEEPTDAVVEETPETADASADVEAPEAPEQEEDFAPAGQARLIVKRQGIETDSVFPLNPPSTIGRFDPGVGPIDVDLADLPEGVYVSRKHAKITCEDDVWKIVDLGSSNGTFVLRDDFERVEEAELADGTEFALGNARFVFRLS